MRDHSAFRGATSTFEVGRSIFEIRFPSDPVLTYLRTHLELRSPILPLPPQRDPKREHDQLEVQPEALLLDVEEVVLELVLAGDITGA